jgi:GTP-binding protein EngB required for normal cell division
METTSERNQTASSIERLCALERLARESQALTIADEAASLAERASEGRFYVACVGQFKRGKSTLLNALTGSSVLPTGIVPVTSVPTVIRYGDFAVRLRAAHPPQQVPSDRSPRDGWMPIPAEQLAEFVSEERNPGNRKGVRAVEVFLPAPLLAGGLCLVDTPGLGSVFEANSEATREFVPHIDAALVILGFDPPLSAEELNLVEKIARDVEEFIFVLNKADRVTEAEAAEAEAFTRRVLQERLGRQIDRLYRVSALERLSPNSPLRDWEALLDRLRSMTEQSGRALVEEAVRRGMAHLGERLRRTLTEEETALRRPLEESARRLQRLRAASEAASRALQDLGPLFDAEIQRQSRAFADRRAAFLRETLPPLSDQLSRLIGATEALSGPALRRQAFEAAQSLAQEAVAPWLAGSEQVAGEAYQAAADRFLEIVRNLLTSLRDSEAREIVSLPPDIEERRELGSRRRFYFHRFHHLASPAGLFPALQWLADLLLPRRTARSRIERDAQAFLRRLLQTNAARVESDLKERLQNSRLHLESRVRFILSEALQAAERAIERAIAVQAAGAEAVQASLLRLEASQAQIQALLDTDSNAEANAPPAA